MNQPASSSKSLNPFLPELLSCFDQREFQNVAIYPWIYEEDVGHVLVSQRHSHGEALVLVFGTTEEGRLLVEFWIRKDPSKGLDAPTIEERQGHSITLVRMTPVPSVLKQTLRFIEEVAKTFYDTSENLSNVVSLADYKRSQGI